MKEAKALYLYLKSRYSKGFLVFMIISLIFMLQIFVSRMHVTMYPSRLPTQLVDEIVIGGSFSIILFGLFYPSFLAKSEIDFLLPTRVNPFKILLIKQVGDFLLLFLFFLYLILPLTSSPILGLLNTVIFSFSLSGILIVGATLSYQRRMLLNILLLGYLLLTIFTYPKINFIYLLLNPLPSYSLLIIIFLVIVEVLLYRISSIIYLNAYSLNISPVAYRRGIIERIPFPNSFRGVIFYTTFFTSMLRFRFYSGQNYKNVRIPTLLIVLPLSILASILCLLLRSPIVENLILIYSVAFYIPYVGQSFQNERVWIDFVGMDIIRYIRARMLARLLLSYIVFTPLALAQYIVTKGLAIPLTFYALPLGSVPLSWFLMSFRPPPQIREVESEQVAYRFSLIGFVVFIVMGIVIWLPVLVSLFLNSLLYTVGLFVAYLSMYITLLHMPGYSKRIWIGFVERLVKNGYI